MTLTKYLVVQKILKPKSTFVSDLELYPGMILKITLPLMNMRQGYKNYASEVKIENLTNEKTKVTTLNLLAKSLDDNKVIEYTEHETAY